ncbi:glycoside hydrolase 100 family protein [Leptolyngbya sp. FACHB-261]|uniref:glycoside hydrolase 100 family protein n=1 Tax=Leptolyngbya sp. FACHB-261 TaxID=2692806 RepID=UPI001686DCED|nr:glycoside hydrolase 100 family protein [Leptolyngbya sp. FACHB-261]MBD2103698.1 alkaline invertase [Leptolyngbya sp. FACHB-261]
MDLPIAVWDNRRLSRESDVIQTACELLYKQALVEIQGQPVGTLAAIPRSIRRGLDADISEPDLNYTEIFIRDNIPTMIYFLLDGRGDIVRNFLNQMLKLQSTKDETAGIFPTSFFEENGRIVADYGQRAIGRVSSVDATLWWPILAHIYVQHTDDQEWAVSEPVQRGISRFLNLILHPQFHDVPTLRVPDGAFMIDRPLDVWGAPLEIQVLLYGALLSSAGLIRKALSARGLVSMPGNRLAYLRQPQGEDARMIDRFRRTLAWLRRLRRYLLTYYWVNATTVQVLRRHPTEQYGDLIANEYNINANTVPVWLQTWLGRDGGYLLGNLRTGRPDFRFFTLGNCLGAIFGLLGRTQRHALFRLIYQNRDELMAQLPMRICHPPLDGVDWENQTGFDQKNVAWSYHNGGHWPCLLWFLVLAVVRNQQECQDSLEGSKNREFHEVMMMTLEDSYKVLLKRLPKQNWPEYFDGPTGLWIGLQARSYQTWTITGLLLTQRLLRGDPSDAAVMDMPNLKDLHQTELPDL